MIDPRSTALKWLDDVSEEEIPKMLKIVRPELCELAQRVQQVNRGTQPTTVYDC